MTQQQLNRRSFRAGLLKREQHVDVFETIHFAQLTLEQVWLKPVQKSNILIGLLNVVFSKISNPSCNHNTCILSLDNLTIIVSYLLALFASIALQPPNIGGRVYILYDLHQKPIKIRASNFGCFCRTTFPSSLQEVYQIHRPMVL